MRLYLFLLALAACTSGKDLADSNTPDESGDYDTDSGEYSGGDDTLGTPCGTADADGIRTVISDAYAVLSDSENTADEDGDGFTGRADCDDNDPEVGGFLAQNATGGESHDLTTIEAAINFASDGGMVTVCGWHNLGEGINLNVDGTQEDWLLTIAGQDTPTGIPAVITGSASSGLEIYASSVALSDLIFFGNTAEDSDKEDNAHPRGAGIRAGAGSTVEGSNVHIVDNAISSSDHGSAVFANDANVTLTGSVIADNIHEDDPGGGGKGAITVDDATVLMLTNSVVVANGNEDRGQSGLFLRDHDYSVTVTNTCFGGNLPHDVHLNETSESHDLAEYVSFTASGSTQELTFAED